MPEPAMAHTFFPTAYTSRKPLFRLVTDAAPALRHGHGVVGGIHAVHKIHRHHHDLAAGVLKERLVLSMMYCSVSLLSTSASSAT